jgi:hypothetical protein
MKQIISILIILLLASGISATSEQINESLYIYGEGTTDHKAFDDTNIDKIIIINGTATQARIIVATNDAYEFDYEFNYAPNETVYYTTIVTLKQEVEDILLWGVAKEITRTLSIDGVEVGTYNYTLILATGTRGGFAFKTLDRTVTFGDITVNNATIFFTELVCSDQYEHIENVSGYANMHIKTIGDSTYSKNELGGLTGTFLNALKRIPYVGISVYNVIYPIMVIIQYTFDFSFTFLNLIIHDWWYALLLLEIICFLMAITQTGYVNVMQVYINTHVIIITFVYHKVMIPIINLSITIISTIRNMFRI